MFSAKRVVLAIVIVSVGIWAAVGGFRSGGSAFSGDPPKLAELSEHDLLVQARLFPEIGLGELPKDGDQKKATSRLIRSITRKNTEQRDGYLKDLLGRRGDLQGLSFAMGDACRIGADDAEILAGYSRAIQPLLVVDPRALALGVPDHQSYDGFWLSLASSRSYIKYRDERSDTIRGALTLEQILIAQPADMRLSMVEKMARVDEPVISEVLARRAVFDLSEDVRKAAIASLRLHPRRESAAILLSGFRYPWSAVAEHAAAAVAALERTDLLGALVSLRNERDPTEGDAVDGVRSIREVVRINHLKNCLLCHPPATTTEVREGVTPVGAVPTEGEPLPFFYYQDLGSDEPTFVRADVTYLRQDFSVTLRVARAHPWPDIQRFDMVTRQRPLSRDEIATRPEPRRLAQSANGPALEFAIRKLMEIR